MRGFRALLAAVILAASAASIVFLAGGASIAEQRLGTPYAELWRGEQEDDGCEIPSDWIPYRVKQGETLKTLAEIVDVPQDELLQKNCLEGELNPGETIFLPVEVLEPTSESCGPSPGWVLVAIDSGETLLDIARRHGITEASLRRANCLGASTQVGHGVRIYVPSGGSSTPTADVETGEPPSPVPGGTMLLTPAEEG
jgi:LysM repeat protein